MAFVFDPEGAPTPACHAPTIVALADRLVVAWFGGTHEKNPDVGIWVAVSRGLDPGADDRRAEHQEVIGDFDHASRSYYQCHRGTSDQSADVRALIHSAPKHAERDVDRDHDYEGQDDCVDDGAELSAVTNEVNAIRADDTEHGSARTNAQDGRHQVTRGYTADPGHYVNGEIRGAPELALQPRTNYDQRGGIGGEVQPTGVEHERQD